MNNRLAKLLTFWIPIKKWRKFLRNGNNYKLLWLKLNKNNNIFRMLKSKKFILSIYSIPFDSILYQRPHHLFENFSNKHYCLYFTNTDSLFKKFNSNMDIADLSLLFILPKSILSKITLIITSPNNSISYLQLKQLRQKGVNIVYDYIDEIHDEINPNKNNVLEIYNNLEKLEPKLVIASAKTLENEMLKKFPREKVILAQNAVNLSNFINADNKKIPEDLKPILDKNRPIVGYYGALAGWLDWELINKMHEQRPDYQFVYIGENYLDNLKHLKPLENVHYLGAKNYQELAEYSIHFDCCTIMFGNDDIAKSTSPLKLFEYMAAKKTVVATKNLLECHGYEGVLIAENHEDFIKKLDDAIELGKNKKIQDKLFYQAQANTWEQKAAIILKALNNNLNLIYQTDNNNNTYPVGIPGLEININGKNNIVKLANFETFVDSCITICANNSNVEIDNIKYMKCTNISIYNGDNQKITIGNNTSIEGLRLFSCADGSKLEIQDDCMLADGIQIWTGDGHTVSDLKTGEILNNQKNNIVIGRNTWVAQDSKILKNAKIPPNTIIGASSVVTKSFNDEYTIIAGNPAGVVKKNVIWNRKDPYEI